MVMRKKNYLNPPFFFPTEVWRRKVENERKALVLFFIYDSGTTLIINNEYYIHTSYSMVRNKRKRKTILALSTNVLFLYSSWSFNSSCQTELKDSQVPKSPISLNFFWCTCIERAAHVLLNWSNKLWRKLRTIFFKYVLQCF